MTVKDYVVKLFRTKTFKNSSWLIAERIYQMIISLVVGVLSARFLGPYNFGLINYVTALVSFFLPLTTLGIEGVLVRELVNDRDNESALLGSVILLRVVSSLLSMISIIILITILEKSNVVLLWIAVFQSLGLIFRAYDTIDYWFQSLLKSKYTAVFKGITYTLTTLYKIFLLITKQDVIWFALSTTIDYFLLMILFVLFYKKKSKNPKLNFSLKISLNILKKSYHFIISGFMVVLYSQLSKIILGTYLDKDSVGIYSVSITLATIWLFVPQAIVFSMQPIIYEQKQQNKNYIATLKILYSILLWGGITYSLLIFIFGSWIVTTLYGKDYIQAIIPLQIYVWSTVFATLGDARSIWIIAENKNKYVKWYLLFGSILNLLLSFILVPKLGTIGAAFTMLFTQIFICLVAPMLFKSTRIHTKYILESLIFKDILWGNKLW